VAAGKLLLCIGAADTAAAGMLQKSSRGRGALPLLAAGEVVGNAPSSALMSTLGGCKQQMQQQAAAIATDHGCVAGLCSSCCVTGSRPSSALWDDLGQLQTANATMQAAAKDRGCAEQQLQ
jgi:hypothetical protein